MTYQDSAKKIIKEHIKTAIYIDENAREPFTLSSIPELFEEKLSLELYKEAPNAVPMDNIPFIIPFFEESLHTIFVKIIIDKEYPITKIIKHI